MKNPSPSSFSRRRALKTIFCSSAALALNVRRDLVAADISKTDLHLMMIGDFGSQQEPQSAVARAMQRYVGTTEIKPAGLWLVGDNFYSKMEGGVKSKRWKTGFDDMYPASVFPGPCWAVLGNHDYHDNAGGEKTQLAYAKTPGTRWTMPAKWYRFDLPGADGKPLVTFYCLDSNLRAVSGGTNAKDGKKKNSLTEDEEKAQLAWLREEMKKPAAPFKVAVAHHPLYSNGSHGDTKALIAEWGDLFEEHGVHAYLCGHDHDLQHLELEGRKTSFILSGGGGARVRALKNARKMPYGKDIYGFTHIQINAERLLFRHIDANGKEVHAFSKMLDHSMKVGV
jgi:tartrate-resistant acid phosphatase type 5